MSIQCIRIADLWCDAVIGIHEEEKIRTQPLGLDVSLHFDASQAIASDVIGDTIDYFTLATAIKARVEANRHELIEGLLDALLDLVMADSRIMDVEISIRKPEALASLGAVVSLSGQRQRSGAAAA